jgi:hypothetical protein
MRRRYILALQVPAVESGVLRPPRPSRLVSGTSTSTSKDKGERGAPRAGGAICDLGVSKQQNFGYFH